MIERRVAFWKGHSLSHGGWLILVNSSPFILYVLFLLLDVRYRPY